MAEDLSQQERDLIANLIRDGKPVPARYIPSISDNPLKTELIWPGKSTLMDTSVLPFQSIEHIDEPRKGTSQQFDLFSMSESTGRQSGGWTNKLIWGDNSLILSSLINGPMRNEIDKAGGLKLVYIDPPFDVGSDFSMDIEVGEDSVKKKPSVVEEVAYRDTWGKGTDSYASMIHSRLKLIHELLADDGTLFLHCDYRTSGITRLILDEIFGQERILNEIVWLYGLGGSSHRYYPRKHDTIFWYSKTENYFFNPPMIPATSQRMKGMDKKAPDFWDIPSINNMATERTDYPTQKPEALLQRVIESASQPGDLVADFFCGSGTTLALAEKLGRKWVGTDLGRFAIHTTRKRLISIQREASKLGQPFRAFEILNLGGYERAHQVGIDPSLDEENRNLQAAIKREEFVDLILSAYGAQKSDQLAPFSGSKGGTAILIGGIDSAVTQDQVQQAIDTALSVGISRVDVLGFEFEMGISPAMSDAAKEQGLTLTVRYIPNEVFDKRAIAKNQVKFYEAGYVEAKCEVKNKTLQVSLTDFGVFYRQNDADDTAAELRNGNAKVVVDQGQVVRVAKDKKGVITKENLTSNWQDWIDYWAVDFDFASQPEIVTVLEDGKEVKKRTGKFIFENEWQSFRTKSDRSLELTSSPFSYADSGSYSVAVKVIDIFGNDTTRVFKIKVK
ncbi:site-specific DNA-methyltransferase [Actinobacteria bacterium IMCC25003]|nr:site-specific DNA-methyltransferase [Actinobacteria bacterium IMCC25003]